MNSATEMTDPVESTAQVPVQVPVQEHIDTQVRADTHVRAHGVVIEELPDDNIGEDESSDAQIAQFIQDMESAPTGKFPSVADLYMQSLESKKAPARFGPKYYDEFDEYDAFRTDAGGVGKNFSLGTKTQHEASKGKSYHPSTQGYSRYEDIGSARKGRSPNMYASGHKSGYRSDYLDEDFEDKSYLDSAVDAISDRVDVIFDCVKSTDQLVNDMYEKQLAVGDAIDELTEAGRSGTMRLVEINAKINALEKGHRAISDEQARMKSQLDEIEKVLREVSKNVCHLRWPGEGW